MDGSYSFDNISFHDPSWPGQCLVCQPTWGQRCQRYQKKSKDCLSFNDSQCCNSRQWTDDCIDNCFCQWSNYKLERHSFGGWSDGFPRQFLCLLGLQLLPKDILLNSNSGYEVTFLKNLSKIPILYISSKIFLKCSIYFKHGQMFLTLLKYANLY